MADDTFWQTKLHARLHDPAEKALVLLRDPEGHENGTSRALHRDLGFDRLPVKEWLPADNPEVLDSVLFKKGIPVAMYKQVKRADWWAAAADRPQWPCEEVSMERKGETITRKVAHWAQVRWFNEPVLIHPLSGKHFDLRTLADTDISSIKEKSLEHFGKLKVCNDSNGEDIDWQKTLLAFWRFGPELQGKEEHDEWRLLWPLLPADTRVPDHSIWDHLDLTSAFAGAFARDPGKQAALFTLSIGPVQSFIEAARTTSDLWAGSHLLSRLSWEAMKVVCERLGPDAVLFPRLRGLPQVDLWLRDEMGLVEDWFSECEWNRSNTDANPLFAAALPNRFVAVVPEAEVEELAESITERVRAWLQEQGKAVVERLLETAGLPNDPAMHCFGQMREQLAGFPEIHWAATSFSLIRTGKPERDTDIDATDLAEAMKPFFYTGESENTEQPGFLGSDAWKVLGQDATFEGNIAFFSPNPGALYPAIYELCERALSATKATRTFAQIEQVGWRCSLTGESEWLTTDPAQLDRSSRQQPDTLWTSIAERKPAWAKKGERLGALSALKRLWPTLYAEEVGKAIAESSDAKSSDADRFVVSTHTMALAGNLEKLHHKMSENPGKTGIDPFITDQDRAPALPRKLAHLRDTGAARIPAVLDRLREQDGDEERLREVEGSLARMLGHKPDAYYALLLFDGDHMGRILSGAHDGCAVTYRQSFHPRVCGGFDRLARNEPQIKRYGALKRAISPNRHLSISAALNDFAISVVPQIVEWEHRGKVIYAGGDDVLAMLPVADLLSAMQRLRVMYSGEDPDNMQSVEQIDRRNRRLACENGFVLLPGTSGRPKRLMRMMGGAATASCGAVIAHHQSPLGAVLRELRQAESRAKNEGGRDAFNLTIVKRSGGALSVTGKWGKSIQTLDRLRCFLADPAVSRRAVYNSLVWLRELPDEAGTDMLRSLLHYQMKRQMACKSALGNPDLDSLISSVVQLAQSESQGWRKWLEEFLSTAEFLAREARAPSVNERSLSEADAAASDRTRGGETQ